VLLSGSLATLVLAITEGPTWGWSSARIVAGFVASVLLGAVFLYRSSRHVEPVLDLQLFRARSFSVANTVALLYAMGFFAMLLGNILFLTSVWHYSILQAGLSVTPGPLVVAVVSGPAGKLAGRFGFRRVLMVGFIVFTAGTAVVRVARGTHAGLRQGLVAGHDHRRDSALVSRFPSSALPPSRVFEAKRYAVGSAVNQTARQVGGALGVAILVVILGTPTNAAEALTQLPSPLVVTSPQWPHSPAWWPRCWALNDRSGVLRTN